MPPSPIRCRGPWKIHRRSSEPDKWLDEMGFFRKHTARDASCLFRIMSENIYHTQKYFHKIRMDCVNFMANERHLFEGSINCSFETYLKEMSNPSEWGGLIEVSAMSHVYRRDFVVFEVNKGPQTNVCNGYGSTIYLFYSPDTKHFDAVYTKDFINHSSFCQSLVYEILYDGVYQLKDLPYAVEKMLHDKVPTNHIEYFMSENVEKRKKHKDGAKIFIETSQEEDKDKTTIALKCKHHTQDLERASLLKESLSIFVFNRSLIQLENICLNCLNINSAKDLLDNGITPFPYKVAKALDPDIYRNIEFDVWSELRRELRFGARFSDGRTLQVGVKCLCALQPELPPVHCHIQEMASAGGPCLVFIEELGEKRVVDYSQLRPLPPDEVRPWAPPYRLARASSQLLTLSQVLQQIGNITRKQGLSKTRKANKPNDEKPRSPDRSPPPKNPVVTWPDDRMYYKDAMADIPYQPLELTPDPPVEIEGLPEMVDCRPASAAPPHDLPHNGAPPPEAHHNQVARIPGGGEMGAAGGSATPPQVRVSTPAAVHPMNSYGMSGFGVGCPPYACGKGLVYCAPPPPAAKSVQPSGADLPMHDIPTLRYYYNLGLECMWAAAGHQPPPLPPPPPPPRHYGPRDLAQEMQQMSMAERGPAPGEHKPPPPKPQDKPGQHKGNGQRPLLGPRFKRNNNGDGGQASGHGQNKHNNNMNNKGPNNHSNARYRRDEPEPPPPPPHLPYMPFPPPMFPVHYYPIEHDPQLLMGSMGYVGYDEGVDFGAPVQYLPPAPPYPPPPLHHPMEHGPK